MKNKTILALLAALAVTVQVKAGTLSDSYLEYEAYRDTIPGICEEVGNKYGICPELLEAVIEKESSGDPTAENGKCKGLMQVSVRWHKDRMERLGVKDIFNPYGNVLVAADYLHDLFSENEDAAYVLMRYSMNPDNADRLYEAGKTTEYAREVLERAAELERERGK